jgi:hypothetical protein
VRFLLGPVALRHWSALNDLRHDGSFLVVASNITLGHAKTLSPRFKTLGIGCVLRVFLAADCVEEGLSATLDAALASVGQGTGFADEERDIVWAVP